ncbi:PulJ/GspJ family protein [Coraliomargarita sp. W4R53]
MNTLSTSSQKKRRSAFTLIEIMVATVIMVVLVGLVIQITSEVLKVWNRSSGKLSSNAEARIAMDLLTQDLETAVFRNNGLRWLEAKQENVTNPFSGTGFVTTKLKLFSPALDLDDSEAGDICGVSYLLDYGNPIDGGTTGDQTFILYRNLITPQKAFDELMGVGNQEDFIQSDWGDIATKANGDNYLVSNIVDFRIDFYVEGKSTDAAGTVLLVSGDVLFGGNSPTVGSGAADPVFARPLAYADITLTVIPDSALQIIQNNKLGQTGYTSWADYIAANGEVYTRRVNFLARPL